MKNKPWKKTLILLLVCLGLLGVGNMVIGAEGKKTCTPTNISYCKQGSTFLGSKYKTYTVRCSDGTRRSITAWNDNKKWCVGAGSQDQCTNDQLKAAKMACQSS